MTIKSVIEIVFDSQESKIEFNNLSFGYGCDVLFGVKKYQPVMNINGLKFGFQVKINEEIVFENSYPPEYSRYVSTDQDFIVFEKISAEKFIPGVQCKITAWAENENGIFYGELPTFIVKEPKNLPSGIVLPDYDVE